MKDDMIDRNFLCLTTCTYSILNRLCTFMVVTFSCKIGIWPISSVLRVPFLYNGTSVPY